jgi:hypothetical protein
MAIRRVLTSGVAVAGSAALVLSAGAGVAEAKASVCDAYSSTCHPTQVKGVTIVKSPRTHVQGSSLPFTGGEIALMSLAGVGALAGGTMFVAAGRRRTRTA